MTTTIVLNPVSFPLPSAGIAQVYLGDLTGKTIGFLSNNKPNADILLQCLAGRLQERFGIIVKHYNKGIPSLEIPRELLSEISKNCQGVVLAAYD
ncbi:MAG: hypothetical protein ABSB79_04685 [Syntrophales bacterium]|jgi:hypothetical protein